MRFYLVLAAILAASSADHLTYEGFKVYQLIPKNEEQRDLLKLLRNSEDYDFWSAINKPFNLVTVMVNPRAQDEFVYFLQNNGIEYTVLLENVERSIQSQLPVSRKTHSFADGEITFDKYYTYDEIQVYLRSLTEKYPHASVENIGKSYEGRDLNVIKLSSDPSAKKPVIFIDGGMHAREWISTASALYIIHELVENPSVFHLLDKVDWHIMPLLNPDGYAFTFSDDRMWRKTRSPNKGYDCFGTDPNRNFGFHWGGEGSSKKPCKPEYRGKEAFSEAETRALRDYILKIKDSVKLYLTFHCFAISIVYPWSYTSENPENAAELDILGKAVAAEIKRTTGGEYEVGSSAETMGETAGSSDDWVMGEAGVKLAYTIELITWGHGFATPPDQIINVVKEAWVGTVKFHEYVASQFGVA